MGQKLNMKLILCLISLFIAVNEASAQLDPEIPQGQFSVTCDSEETAAANNACVLAIDGDTLSFWHTEFSASVPAHPHEIVVNLGGIYDVSRFLYTPRNPFVNGRIANWEAYVGPDGVTWGSAVASGTWPNTTDVQDETLPSVARGRFFRLVATSEVNGGPWTSLAEINIYGVEAPRRRISPVFFQ
jgi:hypothetical protein